MVPLPIDTVVPYAIKRNGKITEKLQKNIDVNNS